MIRIGISGWRYAPWRGVWYPEALARRRELEFCGHHFSTVEINGSFYSLQGPESYDAGSSARRFSSRPRLSREGRGNDHFSDVPMDDLVHGLFGLRIGRS